MKFFVLKCKQKNHKYWPCDHYIIVFPRNMEDVHGPCSPWEFEFTKNASRATLYKTIETIKKDKSLEWLKHINVEIVQIDVQIKEKSFGDLKKVKTKE